MYRVVIVEDDPMVSFLNRTYMEKDARFQVVQTFQNGQAALELAERNPADLVILDVYMPVFTGLELLAPSGPRRLRIDAIMVTAANDAPTVDALLKLGVVDYLVKPFTYERFQQALDTFCRHREAVAGEAVSQGALDQLFYPRASRLRRARAPAQRPPGEHPGTGPRRSARRAAAGPHQRRPRPTRPGLSVVTVRRYVNYLVERGEASSTVNYDTGGRPCRLYHIPGVF